MPTLNGGSAWWKAHQQREAIMLAPTPEDQQEDQLVETRKNLTE
jgi:hypothetical protein